MKKIKTIVVVIVALASVSAITLTLSHKVYAAKVPATISLNSPVSFPIDI